MTRSKALEAILSAGIDGDQARFMRLYVEHRISYAVAMAEYRKGKEIAKNFARLRDV